MKKKYSKRKIFSILFFITIIILVIGFFFYFYFYPELSYQPEVTISVGEEIPRLEYFFQKEDLHKINNSVIQWEQIPMEENKIYQVGTYLGTILYRRKSITLKLVVIDTIAPEIQNVKNIEITEGEVVDLLGNITVQDNSHEKIKVVVHGEYDSNTPGDYMLTYVAEDSSGNKTYEEFHLIVKKKEEIVSSDTNSSSQIIMLGTTTKGYPIEQKNGVTYVNGILIANKTYVLPSNYAPGGLLPEVTSAFSNMQAEAISLGLSLNITSGYRSYYDQQYIYNHYVTADGQTVADTYSARAGHSEHQTGLAFDLNSITMEFADTNEGKWVAQNCYRYGFIIRYPEGKESITGYMYEPWHLRYVGTDLAMILYQNGDWLTLEEYLGITSQYSN